MPAAEPQHCGWHAGGRGGFFPLSLAQTTGSFAVWPQHCGWRLARRQGILPTVSRSDHRVFRGHWHVSQVRQLLLLPARQTRCRLLFASSSRSAASRLHASCPRLHLGATRCLSLGSQCLSLFMTAVALALSAADSLPAALRVCILELLAVSSAGHGVFHCS